MASTQPGAEEKVAYQGDSQPEGTPMDEKTGAHLTTGPPIEDAVHDLAEKLGHGQDGLAPLDDIEYVADKIDTLSIEDCREYIATFLHEHKHDYNFSVPQRRKFEMLAEGPLEGQSNEEWELELKTETALCKFYSPYPEVRAITTPTDDPNIPCETIRAHLLGYIWVVLGQFTNSLFNSRFPAITLSSSIVQILLYPCGITVAKILPDWGVTIRGQRISLNPGPWTYKEQMLATIIVDVGLGSAYCFSNIQTQTLYYHDKWLTPGYGILLLLSTQLMGIGFSGLLRRFVVYPIEAIWPWLLPTVALNRALLIPEKRETVHGWSISRYKFFFIAFTAMFFYFWIPDFIFPAISLFPWMTWIAPNNFTLNMITGAYEGMGFNPISSFDWNIIGSSLGALAIPTFAYVQQYIGAFLSGLVIIAVWYSNVAWTAFLPINSSGIYDNTGVPYNISRVIIPGTGVLVEEQYKSYSPAFYSAANLVLYGAFFAFYPLTMVFVTLDAWRPISKAFGQQFKDLILLVKNVFVGTKDAVKALASGDVRGAGRAVYKIFNDGTSVYDGFDDPLTQLMRAYPEVPDWWFAAIGVIAFIFSIIVVTNWPELGTPVWTLFFVIIINFVFLIPMSYLNAISGSTEGLNVVTELVVGYALPGHPEALMLVKAFGYNINGQADNYTSDQKMGFYAKLPPRAMYRGQVTSAVITALVCYAVVQFVDTQIPGICTPDQPSKFNCENGSQVYFSSSVLWGAIGPARIFSEIYPTLKYTFLLGFLLGLTWWAVKNYGSVVRGAAKSSLPNGLYTAIDMVLFTPISWLYNVHPSLIFNGALFWAPTNLSYFTTGLYVSFGFNYYLRRYKTAWWERYNYVLSAALDGGVAFAGLIIFFALQYHPINLDWWGTDGAFDTLDGGIGRVALLPLPKKGTFGPTTWS